MQDGEQKSYCGLFYSNLNSRRRLECGGGLLPPLCEDLCIPNSLMESMLRSGGASDERSSLIRSCEMFCCDEKDLTLSKLHVPIFAPTNLQVSPLEDAVQRLFDRLFSEHKEEILANRRITHMKLALALTHDHLLKSCLLFSSKPLCVQELLFD